MKKIPALICGILIGTTSAGLAQLKVDFDLVDTNGTLNASSATEYGFQSFGALNQTTGSGYDLFRTVTFSTPDWGNVDVTVSSDANPAASDYDQVPRVLARTTTQVNNYDGTLPDLVRDWAGIDTRATNAAPTTMNVGFSVLPAGQYELVSYHQDAADQDGLFDILVNGTQVATNLQIHSSSAGQNPGAGNPPNYVVTPFTSDGSTPVTVSYRLTTTNSGSPSERLIVLNGFILAKRGQGLVVYSFKANPPSVFQGQSTTLSWVTRSNATVYIDPVGDVTADTTDGAGSVSFTPSGGPGTTNTVTLTASDPDTFEVENRTLSIPVTPDLASFQASPNVIQAGQSSALKWLANPGATISIDQGIGNVNAQTDSHGNGSVSVSPTTTTTYTISVTLNSVTSQTNVTVVVVPSGGTGTLTNGLVSYWPMDEVVGGGTKTPDIESGYDLTLEGSGITLTTESHRTNAFYLSGSGLLGRVDAPGEMLPANKHTSFTISYWVRADGPPLDDKKSFAEGSTTDSDPLYTMGTMGGLPGDARGTSMSVFIRRADGVTENKHTYTSQAVFDDHWHNVMLVQSNGVRQLYIDAIPDATTITNADSTWYTNVFNTTAFGGYKRASDGGYFTGYIDDAAIWDRALTPTEVADVYVHGMPDIGAAKPPLTISSFKADFPAVATGDTITLRWEGSPDASYSIDQGVGNVDSETTYGVGSIAVPVNAPTVFTLTASRTGDTPLTRTVSVGVVNGVASGWHLLDDFETYQPGPILGQSQWLNGTGVASVLDRGGNKVLGFSQTADDILGAGLLSALDLNSLSIPQGDKGTLFFRIYISSADTGSNAITLHAGLTDRAARFVGDFADNIGPYLRLEKPLDSDTNISLLAPDGVGAPLTNATMSLDYDKVYDVWMDVTNDVIASNDLFSVYIKADGDPTRTLVFQNLRGDRNPVADETGPVLPTLNKVFFALLDLNQGTNNVLIDDLYLSQGDYLDTVPVTASAFVQQLVLQPGAYSAGSFQFSWNSEIGATYTVQFKEHLTDAWQPLATAYPAGGATGTLTTYTDSTASTSARFYRVVKE